MLKGQGKGKETAYAPPAPPPPPMAPSAQTQSKTAPTERPNSLFGIEAPLNSLRHAYDNDDAAAGAPQDDLRFP